MDSPGDWSAGALFSPSKARVQQAQARDWASVDSWLAKHYGKRLPAFERNEETLQALLTLAAINEDGDEHRVVVEKLHRSAIQAHAKRRNDGDEPYSSISDALNNDGQEHLTSLATVATLLGTAEPSAMAASLCDLTAESFDFTEQLRRLDAQHAALNSEQSRLREILTELRNDNFQATDDLPQQTAEWTRHAKQLKAKLNEYDERLTALRSISSPSPAVQEVKEQAAALEQQIAKMGVLEGELSAFDDLPTDPKLARAKLESAMKKLYTLTAQREKLFEGLVDSR